jgi:hypothetical protein
VAWSLTASTAQFFQQSFAKNVAALWTGLTGLGFAIGGAVTEFVNSCVFVFAKHAYDVGDFVEAKGLKLVVTDVHLTRKCPRIPLLKSFRCCYKQPIDLAMTCIPSCPFLPT